MEGDDRTRSPTQDGIGDGVFCENKYKLDFVSYFSFVGKLLEKKCSCERRTRTNQRCKNSRFQWGRSSYSTFVYFSHFHVLPRLPERERSKYRVVFLCFPSVSDFQSSSSVTMPHLYHHFSYITKFIDEF